MSSRTQKRRGMKSYTHTHTHKNHKHHTNARKYAGTHAGTQHASLPRTRPFFIPARPFHLHGDIPPDAHLPLPVLAVEYILLAIPVRDDAAAPTAAALRRAHFRKRTSLERVHLVAAGRPAAAHPGPGPFRLAPADEGEVVEEGTQRRRRPREDADHELEDGPDGDLARVLQEVQVVEEGEEVPEADDHGAGGAVERG